MANAHDLLMAQRAAMMGGKSLPYLRSVAYLEGNGYQWIDTGIHMRNFLTFDCDFTPLGNSLSTSYAGIFGAYNPNNINSASLAAITMVNVSGLGNRYMDKSAILYQHGTSTIGVRQTTHFANDLVEFRRVSDGSRIDGYVPNSSEISTSPVSVILFGLYYVSDKNIKTPMRCYSFDVYDGDDELLELVPVLDLSGRPAMYDEVSGQFFYNQGTGEFTWGEIET